MARPYEMTPAQETMKSEMEQGLHAPRKLGEAMDEVFGGSLAEKSVPGSELSEYGRFNQQVPELALQVINKHGNLALSLKQWQVVQEMIEAGLRAGFQVAKDGLS